MPLPSSATSRRPWQLGKGCLETVQPTELPLSNSSVASCDLQRSWTDQTNFQRSRDLSPCSFGRTSQEFEIVQGASAALEARESERVLPSSIALYCTSLESKVVDVFKEITAISIQVSHQCDSLALQMKELEIWVKKHNFEAQMLFASRSLQPKESGCESKQRPQQPKDNPAHLERGPIRQEIDFDHGNYSNIDRQLLYDDHVLQEAECSDSFLRKPPSSKSSVPPDCVTAIDTAAMNAALVQKELVRLSKHVESLLPLSELPKQVANLKHDVAAALEHKSLVACEHDHVDRRSSAFVSDTDPLSISGSYEEQDHLKHAVVAQTDNVSVDGKLCLEGLEEHRGPLRKISSASDVVTPFFKAGKRSSAVSSADRQSKKSSLVSEDPAQSASAWAVRESMEKQKAVIKGLIGPGPSNGKISLKYMFGSSDEQFNLNKKEYDVRDLYSQSGICSSIAKSTIFDHMVLSVIVINAIYIGFEADGNTDTAPKLRRLFFTISDHAFCLFFSLEWLVRFLAFEVKRNCLKDSWMRFDTVLASLMITDTWLLLPFGAVTAASGVVGILKLLRLLRLARIGRALRALPELVAMLKGLRVATRAVGAALFMLVTLIYACAIAMFMLLKDNSAPYLKVRFGRLGDAMWTLLLEGTFLDEIGNLVRELQGQGENISTAIFMVFVLASSMTVMNMLIGVLCEVVTSVAAADKERAAIRLVKEQLLNLLLEFDEDDSGLISRTEIQQVLNNQVALNVLHSLQVEESTLMTNLDMYYDFTDEMTVEQIIELILMLRGDSHPTMKHLLQNQALMQWKMQGILSEVVEGMQMSGTGSKKTRFTEKPAGPLLTQPSSSMPFVSFSKMSRTFSPSVSGQVSASSQCGKGLKNMNATA